MDGTPDTVNYMIMGYVVLVGFPILYALSWMWRRRSLEKDLQVIESLKEREH